MWDTAVNAALSKCPFLQELVRKHGEEYARNMVINPHEQKSLSSGEPLFHDTSAFSATVKMFHGSNGVHPLPDFSDVADQEDDVANDQDKQLAVSTQTQSTSSLFSVLSRAPLAAISIAAPGMPGPGDWFRKKSFSARDKNSRSGRGRPSMQFSAAISGAALSAAGGCPLRKWLGPLAPVVFNNAGHFKCPEAIVQMRAALSRTQPVRSLRPQAMPIKFIAVGATAALVNIPFGALREQFEKFSPGWFLAVHATIPFIAMLRKAVMMPKIAIVCTIAAAIAGQALGARLARARTLQAADQVTASGIPAQHAGPSLPPRIVVTPEVITPEENKLRSKIQYVISDITEKMRLSPAYHGDEFPPMQVTSVKV